MAVRTCGRCGRSESDRLAVHFDTVVTETGALRHGALFCRRCYDAVHPIRWCQRCCAESDELQVRDGLLYCSRCYAEGPPPPLSHPKRPRDPEWMVFRRHILDGLRSVGEYFRMERDAFAGWCPRCGEVLHVRFFGEELEVELVCDRGCPENKIAAALAKAGSL